MKANSSKTQERVKMFNSVRVRLTLWYSAMMAGVLIVLSAVTFLILQKNVVRRTDTSAEEQAESFLKTVNAEVHDESGPETLQEALEVAIAEHRFRETVFVVLDQAGGVMASSESRIPQGRNDDAPVESLQDSIRRIAAGRKPSQTVHVGRRAYRSYFRNFSVERKDCTLIVLQSLHWQEEFFETMTGAFVVVIPLAILLASSGGYFLARRSLAPVTAMGAQARQISADNLDQRLAVKNPDDELGKLAQNFNDLIDRIEKSFTQQRRFVADASHELRTPVAILCGESDVTLSQADRSPEEYRESLVVLRSEARRLKHIVEDLFTLARADAGQHPLVLSDFYLDELVTECAKSMRTLAAAKQISLRCDATKEIPMRADESLLRRMLLNLLDNALKYTPPGGEAHISCGQTEEGYDLVIRDTGHGIPDEMQSHIFERFVRVDKARSRGESDGGGAGLGLSISLWIAQAHGGSLELTKSGTSGSTFSVFLPKSPGSS